jgi:hypothetical protein
MKKFLFLLMFFIFTVGINASADLVVYDAEGSKSYFAPDGFSLIAEKTSSMNPYNYYTWGFDDLNGADSIDIVFNNIYHSDPLYKPDGSINPTGRNWLTVAIKDGGFLGYAYTSDGDNTPLIPNWTDMGYTILGVWTDIDGPATKNDWI